MAEQVDRLREEFEADLGQARTIAEWTAVRDKYLGRKSGRVTELVKAVGSAAPAERAMLGKAANELRQFVDQRLESFRASLASREEEERLARERADITRPGLAVRPGRLHPITLIRQRIEDIFVSMGYSVEDGPEIETNYYNFDALNIPSGHPARESQDTFYVSDELALRSQTSTVQIRTMERRKPPLRIIAPGRVFRRDTPDPTHNPMFFQVEGLTIDKSISLADLKGTLSEFVHRMFGPELKIRFRASYFPFVEPGAETDFQCFACHGSGCRICKQTGWIELGGSGIVHRRVLEMAGVDPEEWSGFAFGLGIDRMAALMYGIDDIRLLYDNDVRFLSQFE